MTVLIPVLMIITLLFYWSMTLLIPVLVDNNTIVEGEISMINSTKNYTKWEQNNLFPLLTDVFRLWWWFHDTTCSQIPHNKRN